MKPVGSLLVGSALFGTSLIIAAGDAFLWSWARSSAGASDILARGPFLLAIYLPYLLIASALLTAGIAWLMGLGGPIAGRRRIALAALAVCLGFLLIYIEPTGTFFNVRRALAPSDGLLPKIAIDGALFVVGLALLGHLRVPTAAAT